MIRYCYRRILLAIPVMVGISLLAFILGLLSPGDPAEFALNQDGLDAPTDAQIAAMREELEQTYICAVFQLVCAGAAW